jgi:hypothetical protein
MNHSNPKTICLEMFIEIVKRVPKTAEKHHFVVWQALLVSDDITKSVKLGVIRIESMSFLKDGLDSRFYAIDGVAFWN